MSETADTLAAAFDGGAIIAALDTPVETIEDGYAIQDAVVERLGRRIIGWKLAQTTAAAQAANGLAEATVAPLLEGMIVPADTVFGAGRFHIPEVEAEIVVELASPLEGPSDVAAVKAAAAGVRLAIEVADTRYADKPAQGVPGVIADMNSCGALVVGPLRPLEDLDALRSADVSATLGDGTVVPGLDVGARPDPLAVVAFLTEFLARSGRSLEAGMMITTGTHTPPTKSGPGRIAADFGEAGTLTARLGEPRT